jgi:acyl-CoA thioesterase-1
MVMNSLDTDRGTMRSLTLYGALVYRINLIVRWWGFWRFFPVATVFLVLLGMPAQAREIKLLAFGDSLTAGYGLPKDDGFTEQLQNALQAEGQVGGRDVVVINAGVSGDTSAGGRSRLGWALADKPDAVLLELGANDGLRGLDPKVTHENLDAILSRLAALGIPVLFVGMKAPPNLGEDYGREYRAVFSELSARYDVVFYPFFLEGVAGKPALNQDDGIHPNPKGVATVVARILPAARELLALVR